MGGKGLIMHCDPLFIFKREAGWLERPFKAIGTYYLFVPQTCSTRARSGNVRLGKSKTIVR